MSRLRMTTLALLAALPAAAASADEGAWGTAPSRPAPAAAQLGRPVVIAQTPGAAAPAALLERPRPTGYPVTDSQVRPVSYGPLTPEFPAVFRGQAPDAKPLPAGPASTTDGAIASRNWQRVAPDAVAPAAGGPAEVVSPAPDAVPSNCGGCGGACGGGCGCGFVGSLLKKGWCGVTSLFDWGGCGACACGCDGGACDGAFGCGCGNDGCCAPGNRWYVSAEYLLWWTKGDPVPPLITQGSAGDFANGLPAGSTNLPGTSVLFGGADYNAGARSGGRLMAGWWFGDEHVVGIEGGGFFLGSDSRRFSATGFGTPILARPFNNTFAGAPGFIPLGPNVEFVSEPGVLAGTASASVRNTFWGAEANLRSNLWCGPCFNVDMIAGYRHLALDDNLSVSENLAGIGTAVGFTFASSDGFRTINRFDGGQIGFDMEWRRNRWFLDLNTKAAIGNVYQRLDVTGSTSINGGSATSGGLLTADRVGTYTRNRFAWSPEVGVNLGYQFTPHMRAFVGYDFLYLSDVLRAGDQVNVNVNPNRFLGIAGGPANSPVVLRGTDFWAQGINFGLEFRW